MNGTETASSKEIIMPKVVYTDTVNEGIDALQGYGYSYLFTLMALQNARSNGVWVSPLGRTQVSYFFDGRYRIEFS